MNPSKKVLDSCKGRKIVVTQESEDEFEFIAPPGWMFSTESTYRLLNVDDHATEQEWLSNLELSRKK